MTWPAALNPAAWLRATGRAVGRFWTAIVSAPLPHLKLLLMLGAGMVNTLLFIGLALIIWQGVWPPNLAPRRLDLMGVGMILMAVGMLMVLATLTAVSVRVKGPGDTEVSIGSDQPPQAPSVTATASPAGGVTVTATAPAAPVQQPQGDGA